MRDPAKRDGTNSALPGLRLTVLAALTLLGTARACTTILVGSRASADGSPMTTSTGDDSTGDFRLAKVPRRTWPAGSLRPVYSYNDKYPHVIQLNRSTTWSSDNLDKLPQASLWSETKPIGHIPQVSETYALLETGLSYGIINEHQVAMGESTCPARFVARPVHAGGTALLDVSELTKVALERSTTARQAILTMGSLAEEYGYYGAEFEGPFRFDEAGEAIPVADAREAWMFHILPDDSGSSAIWCAQRIPQDHISAVANSFVLKQVNPDNDDFLCSSNIYRIAKKHGLWTERDGNLHFTHVFGLPQSKPSYSARRVWRVLSMASPSSDLPPHSNAFGDEYPVSVKADRALSVQDVFHINRDHYEGTQFDLTKGLAAGPYGDPDRYNPEAVGNMTLAEALEGSFERSISLFRTSYSYVTHAARAPRAGGPLLWFAPHAPATSVYFPVHVSVSDVPHPLKVGSLFALNSDSLFWRIAIASNYAHRYYSYAINDIRNVQLELEDKFIQTLESIHGHRTSVDSATALAERFVNEGMLAFDDLWAKLVVKYRDGFIMDTPNSSVFHIRSMFYPKQWLLRVGYWDDDDEIRHLPSPSQVQDADTVSLASVRTIVLFTFAAGIVVGGLCVFVARKVESSLLTSRPSRRQFRSI